MTVRDIIKLYGGKRVATEGRGGFTTYRFPAGVRTDEVTWSIVSVGKGRVQVVGTDDTVRVCRL